MHITQQLEELASMTAKIHDEVAASSESAEPAQTPRQKFLLSVHRAARNAAARWNRPLPKLAEEMDARSKAKGYIPLLARIAHMEEKGWLKHTDGWQACADRKSNILKMASRTGLQGKLAEEMDILNSYWGWRGIMEPEYDLLEAYTILDTEAYFKRSTDRQLSLAWRETPHVVSSEEGHAKYIEDRIAQIGYIMGRGFFQFLKEVHKNLVICSNVIVSKVRDDKASGGVKSDRNDNRTPVAGYAIIPPQTIFPFLDGRGHIEKWRRFYKDGRPYRDYLPEDIIHFKWDVKPGHIFGTPRSACFRDDIFALRRLEENTELLLINHLFPLFHVKVGTEKEPCEYLPDGSTEIDYVKSQIMNMPKEGVFVSDHRTEVSVAGAEGKGVDPAPTIQHFKNRVFAGMGVSAIDMGEGDTTNRATADNVSQNLKDMVKFDLGTFSDTIEMEMFREWLQESPLKHAVQKGLQSLSLAWGEIDVDGQIKQETHAANLFGNHGLTQDEFRTRLRKNPLTKEQEPNTHFQKHQVGLEKVQLSHAKQLAEQSHEHRMDEQKQAHKAQAAVEVHKASSTKTTKTTRKFANGGSHTKETTEPVKSAASKTAATLTQPENQHGKNLDPHKAKSAEDPALNPTHYDAAALYDLLVEARQTCAKGKDGKIDLDSWKEVCDRILVSTPDYLREAAALDAEEDYLCMLLLPPVS